MKDHFICLLNYDHYCNKQMIDLLLSTGLQGKAVDLMAHIFTAQEIWLSRCTQKPLGNIKLWAPGNAAALPDVNDKNFKDWSNYINSLQSADFESIISYKKLSGVPFNDPLIDILSHVINHGTHHRAQVGQLLKTVNVELPATDYIHYIRTQKASILSTK
ncbi:hypothetical protein FPZ42_11715 [Mucilaginibacter achroorhodeus]|uniref:Damage-inducible protein DinB n=1 Tax=Mucilaginibacter achroorhodeus TaxID=2599294 RepID=A0A563U4L1_9SPHI|nr:DinB family protein [Mucilaginibacter achroorhodeus]TWR26281.1 hypothetical protein FPZ42_11715 [Mucilaginibacter achroorhodeus]